MTEKELMLTAILDCERTSLYAEPVNLSAEQQAQLTDMQKRRSADEPLQYILGSTEFMGLKINVDPRVLIPRPETELLVENILQFAHRYATAELCILDIGTGSGNIPVALAKALPTARLISLDVSPDALAVARENARQNGVAQQIDFVHVDFFEFIENYRELENHFDIIVSNPPYIATSALPDLPADVKKEPVLALDGGEDGLKFYRVLLAGAKRFLKPGGYLACEIGEEQQSALTTLLDQNGYHHFVFCNDLAGKTRFFTAQV